MNSTHCAHCRMTSVGHEPGCPALLPSQPTHPFQPVAKGWVCPVCNSGVAPWMAKCPVDHPNYSRRYTTVGVDFGIGRDKTATISTFTCGVCDRIYELEEGTRRDEAVGYVCVACTKITDRALREQE